MLKRDPIDLITFTYNRLAYTRVALQTLIDSTASYGWENIRWYIVENASTDGTREFVNQIKASHPHLPIEILQNEKPMVVAANMNLAIGHCTAKYIAKIDNDMLVPPGWLEQLKNLLDTFSELAIVGGRNCEGGELVERSGIGYYPVENVGGNFLARAEPFKQLPIQLVTDKFAMAHPRRFSGFSAWQKYLRDEYQGPNIIGWAYPRAGFIHMDDPGYPDRRSAEYQSRGWGRWADGTD